MIYTQNIIFDIFFMELSFFFFASSNVVILIHSIFSLYTLIERDKLRNIRYLREIIGFKNLALYVIIDYVVAY